MDNLDDIIKKLQSLDIEPWSFYHIPGDILFDILNILEEIQNDKI